MLEYTSEAEIEDGGKEVHSDGNADASVAV